MSPLKRRKNEHSWLIAVSLPPPIAIDWTINDSMNLTGGYEIGSINVRGAIVFPADLAARASVIRHLINRLMYM